MKITWHSLAENDLNDILFYIANESPAAALKMIDEIEDQINILSEFPHAGRIGRVRETRELVIVRTPFIAVYKVFEDSVMILRILHGARIWPA